MMSPKLTSDHLSRCAVVYVRQSKASQVREHQESGLLQYSLEKLAREQGFSSVDIVDEDQGITASGCAERTGFRRVAGRVLDGEVGAIVCLEASRLSRNCRDWHYLLEMCALVGVVVIDPQGVYDPRLSNDRLLLGIKGSLAEYELAVLQQRMLAARDAKVARGKLRFQLPPGYIWDELGQIVVDPDERVADRIRLVFEMFGKLGSARQLAEWLRAHDTPVPCRERNGSVAWRKATRQQVARFLKHPIYAGAYVWGRTKTETKRVGDRLRKTQGHPKPPEQWRVLIEDDHPAYISWAEFERNQQMLRDNSHNWPGERKSGRGGRALLTGLVRCGHCGRKMSVHYRSDHGHRYRCRGESDTGGRACIMVEGTRLDDAVREQLLSALAPHAVKAALQAVDAAQKASTELRAAVLQELESARYEARLAERRYDAVDPDKRLVARQLEARWEEALQRVRDIERQLERLDAETRRSRTVDQAELLALAADLPTVWNAPGASDALRQRIVHLLVHEVIITRTDGTTELALHWSGGCHTQLRLARRGSATTVSTTRAPSAIEVVRKMGGRWPDRTIALTLNRQQLRTDDGYTWTEASVRKLREHLGLPSLTWSHQPPAGTIPLSKAAARLSVTSRAVRHLITEGILQATQPIPGGPWIIEESQLEHERVIQAAKRWRLHSKSLNDNDSETLEIPGIP
jgi:DNA invertase Pin-like site-specific DNA recombinase